MGLSLSRLTNLKFLRLSLILCKIKDEGLKALLTGLGSLINLEKLKLVLIANEIKPDGAAAFPAFFSRLRKLQ